VADDKATGSGNSRNVFESEKFEHFGLTQPRRLASGCRMTTKLNQTSLSWVQSQPELAQPIGHLGQEEFGFCPVLKVRNNIIGEPPPVATVIQIGVLAGQ